MVEEVLFKLRPDFNFCYRIAARDNPKLEAQAIFAVTIGGDGKVSDVALVSQTGMTDENLIGCVTRALRGASFKPPADGGSATVNVPIVFRPPRDAGATPPALPPTPSR